MRTDMLKAALGNQVFMLEPHVMNSAIELLETLAQGNGNNESVKSFGTDEVGYQVLGSTAVISVDGAMYKKGMSGLCMNLLGYDQITAALDKAESDNTVDTIVFRVDTPGGSVAGADELGERIYNSPKRTVTFYENLGASAGIYVFSAADEVYASKSTRVGSIGVVVTYVDNGDNEDSTKIKYITSQNAKNKVCDMDGDCVDRIQTSIDKHEELFYERVMRNTGFTSEQIKETFNEGDVIFADAALESGFIDGITTFKSLIDSLATMPTADGDKIAKNLTGVSMEFNEENFKILLANRDTLKMRLENKEHEMAEALAGMVQMQTDRLNELAVAGIIDEKAKSLLMSVLTEKDNEKASKMILDAQPSEAILQDEGVIQLDEPVDETEKVTDEEKAVLQYLGVK